MVRKLQTNNRHPLGKVKTNNIHNVVKLIHRTDKNLLYQCSLTVLMEHSQSGLVQEIPLILVQELQTNMLDSNRMLDKTNNY